MKRPTRAPKQLSGSLHKRLNAYTLAASAAGVGTLALALPAEAKIIYTAAHHVVGKNSHFNLDLNHDGINDFRFTISSVGTSHGLGTTMSVLGHGANQVWGRYRSASALKAGVKIESFGPFSGSHMFMGQVLYSMNNKSTSFRYPWLNGGKGVKDRYLALKVELNGKAHYGWARLSVRAKERFQIVATLTGYAYETIPGKPIIAGQTHGKDEATLGHLATGASAIPAWRMKPAAATTH